MCHLCRDGGSATVFQKIYSKIEPFHNIDAFYHTLKSTISIQNQNFIVASLFRKKFPGIC